MLTFHPRGLETLRPCWGVNTLMVCHIWYSLKLNINIKQSIKQQLEVPSQLLTLDNSRDRCGRPYQGLTKLKACLGLVGFFFPKKRKKPKQNTQTTTTKNPKLFFLRSQRKLRYSLGLLGLLLVNHL